MADLHTLNYSEMTQVYMSFISAEPKWYLDFKSKYYSFDSNNDLWKHNIDDGTSNRLNSDTYNSSRIRFLVNEDYQQTKVFDNVTYTGDNVNLMNPSYIFRTTNQTSTTVDSYSIINREGTFRFAIPRQTGTDKFASRIKGKYLMCDYTFTNASGFSFTLPFVETTFRYSAI